MKASRIVQAFLLIVFFAVAVVVYSSLHSESAPSSEQSLDPTP